MFIEAWVLPEITKKIKDNLEKRIHKSLHMAAKATIITYFSVKDHSS
jgi:hypothetical protein